MNFNCQIELKDAADEQFVFCFENDSLEIPLKTKLAVTHPNFKKIPLLVLLKRYEKQLTKVEIQGKDFQPYAETFSFLDKNLNSQFCQVLKLTPIDQPVIEQQQLVQYEQLLATMVVGGQGDALGYVIEFNCVEGIIQQYSGLYAQLTKIVSDDTQMTLFATEAVIMFKHSKDSIQQLYEKNQKSYQFISQQFRHHYDEWYETQQNAGRQCQLKTNGYLNEISHYLHNRRAPGSTCLGSLCRPKLGEPDQPINDSKGCGSIMRNGTIVFIGNDLDVLVEVAVRQAAVTHTHKEGWISCGIQTAFQYFLKQNYTKQDNWLEFIKQQLKNADDFMSTKLINKFYSEIYNKSKTKQFVQKLLTEQQRQGFSLTVDYFKSEIYANLCKYGEGWVAEEAFAIGVYCLMQSNNPIRQILIAANHNGDSDSTACVCGQMYGSFMGFEKFPLGGVDIDILEEAFWLTALW